MIYYMSGAFYYFLKDINILNSGLPDSLKVREHFTDNMNWNYLGSPFYEEGLNLDKRDSLMAQVTIDWYKEKLKNNERKKCLVVTNSRHAFAYKGVQEKTENKEKIIGRIT